MAALTAALFGCSGPEMAETPGSAFRDCRDCPEMIVLPGGRFVMGASADETRAERMPDEIGRRERPLRDIEIVQFAIGKYEVSRGEYRAFVAATGRSDGDGCWSWQGLREWAKDPSQSWREAGFQQDDRHPVVCVNWNDAAAYVAWLGARTGKRYRLPSEAEWEYAARAGSSAARPWGDTGGEVCLHENTSDYGHRLKYKLRSANPLAFVCADGFAETAPVGSFRANAFGLQDMLGNVFEWTADCWNETHEGAASDGKARLTGECETRVRRGGAWGADPVLARSAFRDRNTVEGRGAMLGFRVARDLDPPR